MADALEQNEIDALLASVGDEEAPSEPADAHGALEIPEMPRAEAAQPYDFKRPERVSKDQIRAIGSIHEVFARNFGVTLSGLMRTIVDVRVVGVEQLTYNEFIHSLPNPTSFMILQAPPLEGQMCLEMSPLIVYPMIDRLLGGSNRQTFIPQRPLTSIEWRLIQRLIAKALEHLSEVWRNLVAATFELVQTESNPQLVHIVAPNEVVVFITFEIKLGHTAGTMSLCVPFNTIESVLGRLTTKSWFYKPKEPNPTQQQRLLRNLVKGSVEMVTYLGESSIRLSELRDLRPGDLLPLDKRASGELIVQIADRNKFAGRPGQLRGNKAVRITRAAEPDEKL